jgi:hypothetical protein
MLSEIIGISATTATRWASLTAGNWTAYAAGSAPIETGGRSGRMRKTPVEKPRRPVERRTR